MNANNPTSPKSSKTRYTILGVLSLGPRSGYDIRKFIEESISHFWRESFGQIYPALKQLEQEGLIQSRRDEAKSQRIRRVYEITPAGERELRNWLQLSPEDQPVRNELLLKLFFGRFTTHEHLIKHLEEYCERHSRQAAFLQRVENEIKHDESDDDVPFWSMALRLGVQIHNARAAWSQECLDELRHRSKKRKTSKKIRGKGNQ